LADGEHPILAAITQLPDSDGTLATGLLSLHTHPWLTDHTINGTTVIPATALAELAIRTGDETHTPTLNELIIETPLTLTNNHPHTRIHITVGPADKEGARPVTIHSTPHTDSTTAWTRHATGTLA
ncbi:polyketide synthase dehydratase domain-containing protein, partial [Streptomyces aculeolatus]